jgi:two-component system sensor histidine kinase KdpD
MNTITRPDPDELLARIEREEQQKQRGQLKIFFGAAAGVGKTYAMLSAGKMKLSEGVDVVVGLVETHGRAETIALLTDLIVLPPKLIEYRHVVLREFDLDTVLKRRPQLVLVDELAHSNAKGCRHTKRWQDIEELLEAGINVYTTLNVQHLESLNDDINQFTGIQIHETVPDTVFELATEVELIDLPPDELLQRLKEGKVYIPHQIEHALQNFFRKGNLIALRELSLRLTAERVDAQMQDYRDAHSIHHVWQVGERVLVCIPANPIADRLVRAGKRLAATLRGQLFVLYVETPALQKLPPEQRDKVLRVLRFAERLGATTSTLSAVDVSAAILQFAQQKNITKIVLGKPTRRGWKRWFFGSTVDTLIAQAHNINIYLLGSPQSNKEETDEINHTSFYNLTNPAKGFARWQNWLWAIITSSGISSVAWIMSTKFALTNLVMFYLLGVVLTATRLGHEASILTSLLSILAFDFFFVPPVHSFAIADIQYLITFSVMLFVGLTISQLTTTMRSQAKVSAHRERRANVLYALSEELITSRTVSDTARIAVKHIQTEFGGQCVILLPTDAGRIIYPLDEPVIESLRHCDLSVAQWVFDHNQIAGQGTDTLPGANALFLPMLGFNGVIGVLALQAANLRRVFLPEQRRLLDTFINQISQTLERVHLVESAQLVQLHATSEKLRSSLLNTLSHDLQQPLNSIINSTQALIKQEVVEQEKTQLITIIYQHAQHLAQLTSNILDMARLDAEPIVLNRNWYELHVIIEKAVERLQTALSQHQLKMHLPDEPCLVYFDAELMEQVLVNLLDNACKYTPQNSLIELSAELTTHTLKMNIADNGKGIRLDEEHKLFDKFYRSQHDIVTTGVGLGLSVCKAIVQAHGGIIGVHNRAHGGAEFYFVLPLEETI